MKRLIPLIFFLLLCPAAVEAQYFVRDDCNDILIASRITNGTVCTQRTTTGGRTAGREYRWNGSAWIDNSSPVFQDDGNDLTVRPKVNMLPSGSCVDNAAQNRTDCTIGGGGGGGSGDLTEVQGTSNQISVADGTGPVPIISLPATLDLQTRVLQGTNALQFEGATADDNETVFAITDPTADRTITFPDATGNVALFENMTDDLFTLKDDADPSKQVKFQLSGITTTTTNTYAFPSTSGTLEVTANKGVSNGYASLDSAGDVPLEQISNSLVQSETVAPGAGAGLSDRHLYIHRSGAATELYICPGLGTNCVKSHTNSVAYTSVQGNAGSASPPAGGAPLTISGAANSKITTTAADGAPDSVSITTSMATGRLIGRTTASAGVMEEVTPSNFFTLSALALDAAAKLKTKSISFRIGSDTGLALIDTQDESTMWRNNIAAMTITEVWCETDQGTSTINLQRDDGTPANILSANLTCDTTGATGTIDGAEDNLALDDKIDFVMVTAAVTGTPKRITINIKATLD